MLNYQRVFQPLSRHVGSLMSAPPSDVGHIVITEVDDAGTNPAWHG